ncbi:MAG: hypothetical protein OSA84_04805 [Akkermansiaceae bacterium]|nr:hypothetical protein [Akkermansiaceae bacterium]
MTPTPLMICGTLLAAMIGAGGSHFWSVQELVAHFPTTPASLIVPHDSSGDAPSESPGIPTRPDLATTPIPQTGDAQREFFEGMLAEVRALRNENRNMIDQVAETNRDMMKMEFRLDTYSESFRPLPTSEQREDISSTPDDDFPDVLPPRASPVFPLGE